MLSEKDLKEFHEGMFEIDYTLGSTKIIFYPLNEIETVPNLYGETKRAKYKEPIYLTGQILFPPNAPQDQAIQDSSKKDINLEVEITQLGFENYTYVNPESKDKETPRLDPYSIIKGYFIIDTKKYVIDTCLPQGLFSHTFASYKYYCKGVDVI